MSKALFTSKAKEKREREREERDRDPNKINTEVLKGHSKRGLLQYADTESGPNSGSAENQADANTIQIQV